ncbi:MAG TPA: hypothetical protein VFP05_13630, partial [Thermomicrobiales bacterium]|nr:hypothetical protein [Thermomicrobiales bacterium]
MTEPNQKELFDEVDEVNRRFETEALSQPSLVDFFLPTLWPLGFTGEQRLTLPRIEQIPWGNDVEWEDWRLAMKVTAGANFVTIRIHRHEHSAVFDPRLGQYAMELNQQSAVSSPKSESNKEASEETQMISTSPVSFGDIPIPSVNNRATIVQLTTALFETENRSGDLLQWAFCNCLEELNLLEAAYLLATNDLKVRLTTLHNCFPFVPFTAHAQSDSRIISRGSVIPNLMSKHFDYEVEDLTESQFERVLVFSSMLRRKNAMAEYGLRSIAARQTVEQDGNLTASFLEFYTATEMFLDSVLLMMAWEHIEHHRHSKLTVNQVVQWFSGRTSLRSRITNYYRRLNLKGWNPSVQGSA